MIQSTPIPPAARIAAKLRFRERRTLILTVAMIVSSAVLVFLFPHRPAPPRAERNQLLGSGTCIVQESNGALIGKLIGRSPPYLGRAYHPPTYLIEDPRVRTRRTVEVWGTRRVPCSSIHEP
jgi:hypothetical protein